MIKKTFKELQEVDALMGMIFTKNLILRDSKFGYTYKRFYEINFQNIFNEYLSEIEDVRIDNCLEDPTTKAVKLSNNPGGRSYLYSKTGLKEVIKAENKIEKKFQLKEIKITPYFIKDIPKTLTETEIELLKGLIIE